MSPAIFPSPPRHADNAADNAVGDALPDITHNQEVDLLNLSNATQNNAAALPKERSFDLLGSFEMSEAQGNNAMPDLLSNSQSKLPGLDDIFGAFNSASSQAQRQQAQQPPQQQQQQPAPPPPSSALPDLGNLDFNAFGSANRLAASNADPFDLTANLDCNSANSVPLLPTSKETSPQQNQPPPTVEINKDPFADIGNLASGLNLNWGSGSQQPVKPSPMNSAHSTQASSPVHQFGGFPANPANLSATTSPRAPSTPTHPPSQNANASKPDYSRSHFETKAKAANATNGSGAAVGGGVGGDIFADILGQQGYNFASKSSQGPRSINEMRKEELVRDMDPDKLKILEWVRYMIHIRF